MFDDKPTTLNLKDYIIRKMSVKMRMSEEVIQAVIAHQFKHLNECLKDNTSLEVSGLGKFMFRKKAAEKTIEMLDKLADNLEQMNTLSESNQKKLISIKKDSLFLKEKLDRINGV